MSQTHAIACSQRPYVHYFGYLVRLHPTPPLPAFTRSSSNALHYACDGLCGSNEARKCNKGLIEDTGGKLFNFKESEAN